MTRPNASTAMANLHGDLVDAGRIGLLRHERAEDRSGANEKTLQRGESLKGSELAYYVYSIKGKPRRQPS